MPKVPIIKKPKLLFSKVVPSLARPTQAGSYVLVAGMRKLKGEDLLDI